MPSNKNDLSYKLIFQSNKNNKNSKIKHLQNVYGRSIKQINLFVGDLCVNTLVKRIFVFVDGILEHPINRQCL